MPDSGIPGKRAFDQTIEEAKSAIREAIEAFMEECERMGTLT